MKKTNRVPNWLLPNRCPDEQALAAYADRHLIGEERSRIEHHLANCERCAEQVAFLVSIEEIPEPSVPDELLNRALAKPRRETRRVVHKWIVAGAGAVALVAACIIGIQEIRHLQPGNSLATQTASNATPAAETRTSAPKAGIELSQPEFRGSTSTESPFIGLIPDQRLDVNRAVFRWRSFSRAQFYELELLADDGSLVWSQNVQTTSLPLPDSVRLEKGRRYYLKLNVHDRGGLVESIKAIDFVAN